MGWVEALIPPPPASAPAPATAESPIGDNEGLALVSFDTQTGNASLLTPFALNTSDSSGPSLLVSGAVASTAKDFIFACIPDSNKQSVEGVCFVSRAPHPASSTPYVPVTHSSFPKVMGTSMTITSLGYSLALDGAVSLFHLPLHCVRILLTI